MGLCYYSMREHTNALDCFDQSLGMNADYEKASAWKEKVLKEVQGATEDGTTSTDPSSNNGEMETSDRSGGATQHPNPSYSDSSLEESEEE